MKKQFVFEVTIKEKENECNDGDYEKYGRQTLMMKILAYLTEAPFDTKIRFIRIEDEEHPDQDELEGL